MKSGSHTNCCLIGGDLRQFYLAEKLKQTGCQVFPFRVPNLPSHYSLTEAISLSDILILPIPYSKDKKTIPTISESIPIGNVINQLKQHIIFGGCFHKDFIEKCKTSGSIVYDYMSDPTFELKNSIATAEGTIAEAIIHSNGNIQNSNCLILGYGNCGTAIARALSGLSGSVTICARSTWQQALAYCNRYQVIDFYQLAEHLSSFDFIFNTVPALVLTKDLLEKVRKDTTIIDIASKPGGTDFEACENLEISAHLCLGLPGKYSPKTSADIIYQSICSRMAEMR